MQKSYKAVERHTGGAIGHNWQFIKGGVYKAESEISKSRGQALDFRLK
jgi:hypothetical protein